MQVVGEVPSDSLNELRWTSVNIDNVVTKMDWMAMVNFECCGTCMGVYVKVILLHTHTHIHIYTHMDH